MHDALTIRAPWPVPEQAAPARRTSRILMAAATVLLAGNVLFACVSPSDNGSITIFGGGGDSEASSSASDSSSSGSDSGGSDSGGE